MKRINVDMDKKIVQKLDQHIDPTISRNELIRKAVNNFIIKQRLKV